MYKIIIAIILCLFVSFLLFLLFNYYFFFLLLIRFAFICLIIFFLYIYEVSYVVRFHKTKKRENIYYFNNDTIFKYYQMKHMIFILFNLLLLVFYYLAFWLDEVDAIYFLIRFSFLFAYLLRDVIDFLVSFARA